MNAKSFIYLIFFFSGFSFSAFSQGFLPGANTFSSSKTTYITLVDGTEIEGTIEKIDRKKGLIESIKIKGADKKTKEYMAEDIQKMYAAPSGFDKIVKMDSYFSDATKWKNDNYKKGLFEDGYVYFEQAPVIIKKEKTTMLMQLLNPSFSGKIKVYMDPWAGETMSASVGGIKVAGGQEASYYIRKADGEAFKLAKNDYKKEFQNLFGDCEKLTSEKKSPKWSEFEKTVFEHFNCD
jgi:hypothetical protein